jgi:pimeloyl-ACP methyl ester carboxylesterase
MDQALPAGCLQIAALALLTMLPGCRTSEWIAGRFESRPRLEANQPLPDVVVVHSSLGYWPGCNEFVADLNAQGATTRLIRGWEVNHAAQQIAEARQARSRTGPLVLVGYSRGANDALRLTRRLQKEGVSVDELVLMEAAVHDSVPANVVSCLNIYRSSIAEEWGPLRAQAVTVESADTQLVNYNLRFHDESQEISLLTHLGVGRNPAVMDLVAEHVTAALRPNRLPGGYALERDIEVASTRGVWR